MDKFANDVVNVFYIHFGGLVAIQQEDGVGGVALLMNYNASLHAHNNECAQPTTQAKVEAIFAFAKIILRIATPFWGI